MGNSLSLAFNAGRAAVGVMREAFSTRAFVRFLFREPLTSAAGMTACFTCVVAMEALRLDRALDSESIFAETIFIDWLASVKGSAAVRAVLLAMMVAGIFNALGQVLILEKKRNRCSYLVATLPQPGPRSEICMLGDCLRQPKVCAWIRRASGVFDLDAKVPKLLLTFVIDCQLDPSGPAFYRASHQHHGHNYVYTSVLNQLHDQIDCPESRPCPP